MSNITYGCDIYYLPKHACISAAPCRTVTDKTKGKVIQAVNLLLEDLERPFNHHYFRVDNGNLRYSSAPVIDDQVIYSSYLRSIVY